MFGFLARLFDTSGFPPRWHCGEWTSGHGWLHILSDLGVGAAYIAIPCVLGYFILRRADTPFRKIFWLFGGFILACGSTHFMEAVLFWWPAYRLAGVLKLCTVLVSWATVLSLVSVVPNVLAMRSPAELEREIDARKQAEDYAKQANTDLERRVAERTTELTHANAALRASEKRLRLAVEAARIGAWDLDLATKVIDHRSPRHDAILGYDQPLVDWDYTRFLEHVFEEDRSAVDSSFCESLETGRDWRFESRIVRPTGEVRWIWVRGALFRDSQGKPVQMLGLMGDITERKLAEDALRLSQQHFRTLAESLPQLVWTTQPDGHCDYLGPQWVKYTGFPESGQLGFGWLEQMHPDDRGPTVAAWGRTVETGSDFEVEFRIRRADGAYRWFQTRAVALRDVGGAVVKWFGTSTDIEDHKQAVATVERSSAMLRLVLDAIPQGVFWKDRDSRYLGCNRVVARALGIAEPEGIVGKSDADLPSIASEQAEHFVRKDREVMDTEVPQFQILEQMTLADSSTIWLDTNKIPMHDELGRVIGVLGTWEDVTDRKRIERDLREKEERLNATDRRLAEIVHGMTEACFALDSEWRFTFVNDRCEELFPNRRAEMLGRSIWEVFWKLVGTPMERHYRHAMTARVPVAFEAYSPIAERWLDIRVFPSGDGLAAFLLDIHERKRADEERQKFVTMADSSQEFIGMYDLDFAPLYLNVAGRQLLGFSDLRTAREVKVQDYFFPEDRAFLEDEFFPRVLRDGQGEVEIRFRHLHTGQGVWVIYNFFQLEDATGKVVAWASVSRNIDDRKRAEEALRASESRFRGAFDHTNVATVLTDTENRFLRVNEAFAQMFGYSQSAMLGMSMADITHLEDLGQSYAHRVALMAGDANHFVMEKRYVHKDGHLLWGLTNVSLLRDPDGQPIQYVGQVQDITDRKRGEEALRESEAQLRVMANSIPQLVWMAHADGSIFWYNQRWYDFTCTTPEQMEGWAWQSIHDPEVLPTVLNKWKESIATGEPFEMVFPLKRMDGVFRLFLTRVAPVKDAEGRVSRWFGTNTDITEQQELTNAVERARAELEQRVVERTAELEAANKELEAFSYSVSHDLRAPLRAIDGFSRIVLEDFEKQLPSEAVEFLRDIRANTKQMGHLVDDLLEFARLSRKPVSRQNVVTLDLVHRCFDELRPIMTGRRIDLRVGDLPDCQADPSLLKQVWLNLLANAVKYSSKREEAVLEVGVTSSPDGPAFFVRDNGVGFDMRYAHKLFGVFQRLHRAEDYEGTGVGLAIVQRLIHRHGGRVWAEAEPGRGATFFFTIPPTGGSSSERIG